MQEEQQVAVQSSVIHLNTVSDASEIFWQTVQAFASSFSFGPSFSISLDF
jgi:hypothetical protein